jgi:hypothetical protein
MVFNAIIAGFAALEASFSLLQPFVPGDVYAWFTVALIVGNKILRVITTQPLSSK